MNKNIRAVMIVTAIAFTCGVNVYKAKKTYTLSDMALANVEALAQEAETGDQFTQATCCVAVWDKETCNGCDGKTYSYAIRQ
jgi:hypothetical protein